MKHILNSEVLDASIRGLSYFSYDRETDSVAYNLEETKVEEGVEICRKILTLITEKAV